MPEPNEIFLEIQDVVFRFYKKATTDFLISYHFRHIKDFNEHIPHIAQFWELQLLGKTSTPHNRFQLIEKHIQLKIKRGEVGRWVLLFEETLDESDLKHVKAHVWKEKIHLFKDRMLAHPKLFQTFS